MLHVLRKVVSIINNILEDIYCSASGCPT